MQVSIEIPESDKVLFQQSEINDYEKLAPSSFEIGELADPPQFTLKNAVRLVGPGAILLGTAIGSGEWLIGPAVTARYGGIVLWVAGLSIVFQAILNTEFMRYTLYTGEPVINGFLRTKPFRATWGPIYVLLAFLQLAWPAWAVSSATALAALYLGRTPSETDLLLVKACAMLCFLFSIAIVLAGKRTERSVEIVQWFFITGILLFFVLIALFCGSAASWTRVIDGFLAVGSVPTGVDWVLLGSFAAYAGAGGLINAGVSNWARDKGFGMGAAVGFIPGTINSESVRLSPRGKIFAITLENLSRWKRWWAFVRFDQYFIWAAGSVLGMALPAVLTLQFIPPDVRIEGYEVAVFQARAIGASLGAPFWYLTLVVSFWILFSTQLGITDCFARIATDVLWSSSARVRAWSRSDVQRVYCSVLLLFSFWGVMLIGLSLKPMMLIQISAQIAGFNFVVLGLHTLYLNTTVLPKALHPPRWKRLAMLATVGFFGFFFVQGILKLVS